MTREMHVARAEAKQGVKAGEQTATPAEIISRSFIFGRYERIGIVRVVKVFGRTVYEAVGDQSRLTPFFWKLALVWAIILLVVGRYMITHADNAIASAAGLGVCFCGVIVLCAFGFAVADKTQ